MQEIKIADIANGGAANGGQDIFFDVKTDDVQEYRVLCPYGEDVTRRTSERPLLTYKRHLRD